jgi:RNA polymerase sigma factor (sigma-70 family)
MALNPNNDDLALILGTATDELRRMGASAHDTEEAAQITLTKLWYLWDREDVCKARNGGERSWRAFIKVTARRVYFDLLRRRGRWIERNNRAAGGVEAPRAPRPGTVLAVGLDDPTEIEELLARSYLVSLLARLPERQRLVAYLSLIQRWTVTEIADHLGVTTPAVSKQKKKALASLRRQIQADNS